MDEQGVNIMNWIMLILAGGFEVAWAVALNGIGDRPLKSSAARNAEGAKVWCAFVFFSRGMRRR